MVEQILTLRKAQRSEAFLKLGISGGPGSGKTMSSLLMGYGLVKGAHPDMPDEKIWDKIVIVDTEHGSGELYVGTVKHNIKIGEYLVISLDKPFTAEKFIKAMDICAKRGDIEVCILDSSSHLWAGSGGLLQQQQQEAKRTGNKYTAWGKITPMHNAFVEKILQTPMHIITTMRAKPATIMNNEGGQTTIKEIGLQPIQRKGISFEFTIFMTLNEDHEVYVSKDRTDTHDSKTFIVTPQYGIEMIKWLKTGTNAEDIILEQIHMADPEKSLKDVQNDVIYLIKKLGGSKNRALMNMIKKDYTKTGNTNSIKDKTKLSELQEKLQVMLDRQNLRASEEEDDDEYDAIDRELDELEKESIQMEETEKEE